MCVCFVVVLFVILLLFFCRWFNDILNTFLLMVTSASEISLLDEITLLTDRDRSWIDHTSPVRLHHWAMRQSSKMIRLYSQDCFYPQRTPTYACSCIKCCNRSMQHNCVTSSYVLLQKQ